MVRTCILFVVTLAACGDDGAPRPDAQTVADAATDATIDTIVDAGACSVPGECECFSNDDCPDGTRCHAETPKSVYCEPGARGTGAAGAMCSGENDCQSALCVDGTDTTRCSKLCTDNTQCPTELPRCLNVIGICARAL